MSLGVASCGLCHFLGGGKFSTMSFQRVASSGLCFFSLLARIAGHPVYRDIGGDSLVKDDDEVNLSVLLMYICPVTS